MGGVGTGVTARLVGGRQDAVRSCLQKGVLVVETLPVRVVVDYFLAGIIGLDGGARCALLTGPTLAPEVFLTHLFAVAHVADFAGLGLGRYLADAVLADKIGAATVCGITQVSFAAKDTSALLGDVRIQRD